MRREVLVLGHLALLDQQRLALDHQPDVEGGPPHVGGDHLADPELLGQVRAAVDAGGGPGAEGEDRAASGDVEGHRAARRTEDLRRRLQPLGRQPVREPGQVAVHRRADIAVEDGGDGALVLAPARQQVDRGGEEGVGKALGDELADAVLVLVVADPPEQADRHRLGVVVEAAQLLPQLLLLQRHDDLAVAVDALHRLGDHPLRHDRLGLVGAADPHHLLRAETGDAAVGAHEVDRVGVARGAHQRRLRAFALDHRVGPDRRPVDHAVDRRRDAAAVGAADLGDRVGDRGDDPVLEGAGGGQRLAGDDAAVAIDEHTVGEGPTDIDAAEVHQLSFSICCFAPG